MGYKCFFSFHYKADNARASQVRNIGVVEGNQSLADNDWESVTKGGEAAIKKWIDGQINGRHCTVVLVGSETANRKWINYEIIKAWDSGLGVVGVFINGLKDFNQNVSKKGASPFAFIKHGASGKMLSEIVKCYDPAGSDSKERYAWIAANLESKVAEAIKIRNAN